MKDVQLQAIYIVLAALMRTVTSARPTGTSTDIPLPRSSFPLVGYPRNAVAIREQVVNY